MELTAKLQIKPGENSAVVNAPESVSDALLGIPQLEPADVYHGEIDTLIIFAASFAELTDFMHKLNMSSCHPKLKLWIAYPKGKALGTDINRDTLNAKMLSLDWDCVRLISLDDTWSIMRFKWIGA